MAHQDDCVLICNMTHKVLRLNLLCGVLASGLDITDNGWCSELPTLTRIFHFPSSGLRIQLDLHLMDPHIYINQPAWLARDKQQSYFPGA